LRRRTRPSWRIRNACDQEKLSLLICHLTWPPFLLHPPPECVCVCFVGLFYCSVILIKNFAQLTVAIAVSPVPLNPFCRPACLSILTFHRLHPKFPAHFGRLEERVASRQQCCRHKSYFVPVSPLSWPRFHPRFSLFCYFYAAKPPLKPYAKYGHVKMCKCLVWDGMVWDGMAWVAQSCAFFYLLTALMSPC